MKTKYQVLYKELIKAYYNKEFEQTFERLLNEEFENKEEAKSVLSTLCGVDIDTQLDDYTFMQTLIHAITQNKVKEKVIAKVHACTSDCENVEGKSKCQSVCPFDAIIKIGEDKSIDETLCMSCGRCVTACDAGHYMDVPQFLPLSNLLKENHNVVAIVAPAIAGQFGADASLDKLREAFIKIGFSDMVEVAMAADVLSIKEALEFNHHVKKEGDFMITSCCCPMWVAALRKVYDKLVPDLSPSVSPMIAMARILKKLNPEVKVVFIGPCIAKKAEAKELDLVNDVDFVLTFQEVKLIFEAFDIHPSELQGVPSVDYASTGGRLYAHTGGVSEAVWDIIDQLYPEKRKLFTSKQVDGMKDCKELLNELEKGNLHASFIEGMGCKGGCVGGPKAIIPASEGREHVDITAYDSAIKIPVHSQVLTILLNKLGIEDFNALVEKGSMFERTFK